MGIQARQVHNRQQKSKAVKSREEICPSLDCTEPLGWELKDHRDGGSGARLNKVALEPVPRLPAFRGLAKHCAQFNSSPVSQSFTLGLVAFLPYP